MPSWQSRFLRLAHFTYRAVSRRSAGLDVAQERRNMAVAERLFKLPPTVNCAAVSANGLSAEW